jgi:diguanylate cyclase (GGDEF)-like protein
VAAISTPKGRILIVDDDQYFRQQLSDLVGGRGFEVDLAASAEAAIKKIEGNTYDAVFLDLVLPGIEGLELLEQILALRPDLSVVIVTGYGSIESCVNAMKKGAYHYLTKPVEEEVLDLVLRNCVERSRLLQQNAALRQETLLDDLTTAFNRRYMDDYLEEELERSRRYGHTLSLLFLDLDHLKAINDQHGHQAGSQILCEVAQLIQGKLRKSDRVFRYGGDEFVVTLPETSAEGALRLANRLRRALRSHSFLLTKGLTVNLTASFGVATYPEDGSSKETLIRSADLAMYRVKTTTRDGVAVQEAQ